MTSTKSTVPDDRATDEWQVAGIKQAMASLDRGEAVAHQEVKDWIASWGSKNELPPPKSSV
jgi:predicted transcriptional regulator